mmetsp:Transcript_24604/g.58426  ORF Transcript_24604/g.58426 Transcript_24604/m.58426 type:complete len:213 (-) Transcript_24604:743-1381(-)
MRDPCVQPLRGAGIAQAQVRKQGRCLGTRGGVQKARSQVVAGDPLPHARRPQGPDVWQGRHGDRRGPRRAPEPVKGRQQVEPANAPRVGAGARQPLHEGAGDLRGRMRTADGLQGPREAVQRGQPGGQLALQALGEERVLRGEPAAGSAQGPEQRQDAGWHRRQRSSECRVRHRPARPASSGGRKAGARATELLHLGLILALAERHLLDFAL